MLAGLGLLALGASLGLSVDAIGDVPAGFRADLTLELTRQVQLLEGSSVVLDEEGSECMAGSQCVAELRSRTSSLDVLILRVIGGPIRLRIVAERTTPGERVFSTELELLRDQLDARAVASKLSVALGFESTTTAEPVALDEGPSSAQWWAVSLGAVGLASLGTGLGFAASSQAASDELSTVGLSNARLLELDERSDRDAVVANILFGVAATAVLSGVFAWAFE